MEFNYDEEMVEQSDVITFDKPTATDAYDTNLLVKTYYSFEEEIYNKKQYVYIPKRCVGDMDFLRSIVNEKMNARERNV